MIDTNNNLEYKDVRGMFSDVRSKILLDCQKYIQKRQERVRDLNYTQETSDVVRYIKDYLNKGEYKSVIEGLKENW